MASSMFSTRHRIGGKSRDFNPVCVHSNHFMYLLHPMLMVLYIYRIVFLEGLQIHISFPYSIILPFMTFSLIVDWVFLV